LADFGFFGTEIAAFFAILSRFETVLSRLRTVFGRFFAENCESLGKSIGRISDRRFAGKKNGLFGSRKKKEKKNSKFELAKKKKNANLQTQQKKTQYTTDFADFFSDRSEIKEYFHPHFKNIDKK
jgi:hypothetical protein